MCVWHTWANYGLGTIISHKRCETTWHEWLCSAITLVLKLLGSHDGVWNLSDSLCEMRQWSSAHWSMIFPSPGGLLSQTVPLDFLSKEFWWNISCLSDVNHMSTSGSAQYCTVNTNIRNGADVFTKITENCVVENLCSKLSKQIWIWGCKKN